MQTLDTYRFISIFNAVMLMAESNIKAHSQKINIVNNHIMKDIKGNMEKHISTSLGILE